MKLKGLDKVGTVGAVLAAAACPACFPLLAVVGAALGLTALGRYEHHALVLVEILVVIAALGNVIAFGKHRQKLILALGLISPGLVLYAYHVDFHQALVYIGLFGLLITTILNSVANGRCATCKLPSPE